MRSLRVAIVLIVVLFLRGAIPLDSARACNPFIPIPADCLRSASVVKGIGAVFVTPMAAFVLNVPVRVNTISTPSPGATCSPVATVEPGGTVTVNLIGPGGPFTNTVPLPPRPGGFQTGVINVPVTIPAGTVGLFVVQVSVDVPFSADQTNPAATLTAIGDTQVCFVEPAPNDPTIPRLDIQTLVPLRQCAAGLQVPVEYVVTNNDPDFAVDLTVTVTSEQEADIDVMGLGQGFFAISGQPGEDDFPIAFVEDLPPDGILPLPADPTQDVPPISKGISIPPLSSVVVTVVTRSFPACGNGSCAASLFTVEGMFDNGDDALACLGTTLNVNNEDGIGCCGLNFTDSVSRSILTGNSVACNAGGITADNGYYRNFDLAENGITTPINVVGIEIGVEVANPGPGFDSQPVNINLYYDVDDNPAPLANLVQIAGENNTLSFLPDPVLHCFELDVEVDPTVASFLTVEVDIPDAFNQGLPHSFFFGSNPLGQESESYIRSVACAIPEPVTTGSIGFGNTQFVMAVYYTIPSGAPGYLRGDCDHSGVINPLVDALFLLAFGFQGGPQPPCLDEADVDGNGVVNALADVLYLLAFGFQGGPPPPAPFPNCAPAPTPAGCAVPGC